MPPWPDWGWRMSRKMAQAYLEQGQPKRILEDWCVPFSGYYLYYPNRRQASLAFTLLVEALRYGT